MVLDVEGLRVVDAAGVVQVDDVSFSVREGEIYAIAGVQGNGQTEVTECLVGLETPTAGRISVAGPRRHDVVGTRPARSRRSATCRRIARTTGW